MKKIAKPNGHFAVMQQIDVPQSRNGKHRKIVHAILDDVRGLKPGSAVKVPLSELGDTKENVRAALSRATRKQQVVISTAADGEFLYVWRTND